MHANFGGPGTEAAFNAIVRTDRSNSAPYFPGSKVVEGYDFAGDAYDPPAVGPSPDNNPLDCASSLGGGHGSHVAGTAAGFGVTAAGATYTGTYGLSTPFNTLRIGPGVAPHAQLYAIRVFGCDGSTDLVIPAIDWAMDPNGDNDFSDHLDVINMSLGSPFGSPTDSDVIATNNAALIGVIPSLSAGNSSDTYFNSGSPGSAERAITVASSVDSTDITDGFMVITPTAIVGTSAGGNSVAFNWFVSPGVPKPDVTASVAYNVNGNTTACTAWPAGALTGKIVLVDWAPAGTSAFPCGSAVRANNATNAGAVGIIMASGVPYLDTAITGNASIPAIFTTYTTGAAIKAHLADPSGVIVTMTASLITSVKLVNNSAVDTLSSFSSRGPTTVSSALKPDIAAPGQSIFSTNAGTGNLGESLNGTSMAAPHITGVMALLRQAHPTWTVEELKALAMNTAGNELYTTDPSTGGKTTLKYSPSRVGAGRVDVPAALNNNVLAYADGGSGKVSVSFGAVEVVNSATMTRTVVVSNKGATVATYAIGYDARATIPGVSYSFPDGPAITVAPGSTGTFTVQLNVNAALLKNTRDATVAGTQLSNPRQWIPEAQGIITLTQLNKPTVRVPVYASVRPASTMSATGPAFFPAATGSTTLPLSGQGINTGTSFPTDYLSLVTALELQGTNAMSTTVGADANIQYVGITSDAPARIAASLPLTSSNVYFGISTYGQWSMPGAYETEFDIYIDTNNDNTDDYILYNDGLLNGTDRTDVQVSRLIKLATNGVTTQSYLNVYSSNQPTALYNNSVLILPVSASALGLTSGNSRITYHIETFSRSVDFGQVDSVGPYTYDIAAPGLEFNNGSTGVPMYADLAGASIPMSYNLANFQANSSLGALLLHHFNVAGTRGQAVMISPLVGTATPTATAVTTPIAFSDVAPSDYFYTPVQYLAAHGVIGGYSDGTFRPYNNTTRGQMAKIVVLGYNLSIMTPGSGQPNTYQDVDQSNVFYSYIETVARHGVAGGYACGGPSEPCDILNRPYYRPGDNITRGQLTKIVVIAANLTYGWPILNPATASFTDVPTGSTFYSYVETAVCHQVLGGYADGTFRPSNNATRGQIAKIVYNAITQTVAGCN
jgi:subtilisin family serine protease